MKNYFNYFTEVEEHFIRRRGKNLLVSPLDWCLIELWRDSGIPLHVVLRGIDRSFESDRARQKRSPTTLYYCHPAIIEAFEEYNQAMVGSTDQEPGEEALSGDFSRTSVVGYFSELENRLLTFSDETFARAAGRVGVLKSEASSREKLDYRELDRDLAEIGSMLADSLKEQMEGDALKELRAQVKAETKVYRRRLSKEMAKKLENSYLDRKVLSWHQLPEFTLLAMV